MTTYYLDVTKWRCGAHGKHALGIGNTFMINNEGFSCCLGQFALQKDAKIKKQFTQTPLGVGEVYDSSFVYKNAMSGEFENTNLSKECIFINDDLDTTPKQKIKKLRDLLETHGHILIVINEDKL